MCWKSRTYRDDAPGRRGIETSEVMKLAEEDIERRFPGQRGLPLLVVPWSDGTALTHKFSANPVVSKVANVTPELYTKRVRPPSFFPSVFSSLCVA